MCLVGTHPELKLNIQPEEFLKHFVHILYCTFTMYKKVVALPAIIITEYHQDLILHLFDFSIQQCHGDLF